MGEGQKAPNFLDDRILASCKVFTSDRLLRMFIIPRPLAILMFSYSYFLFAPRGNRNARLYRALPHSLHKTIGMGPGSASSRGIGFSRFAFLAMARPFPETGRDLSSL